MDEGKRPTKKVLTTLLEQPLQVAAVPMEVLTSEDEGPPSSEADGSSTKQRSQTESCSDMDLEEGEYQQDTLNEPSLEEGEVKGDLEESSLSQQSIESREKRPSLPYSLPSDLSLEEIYDLLADPGLSKRRRKKLNRMAKKAKETQESVGWKHQQQVPSQPSIFSTAPSIPKGFSTAPASMNGFSTLPTHPISTFGAHSAHSSSSSSDFQSGHVQSFPSLASLLSAPAAVYPPQPAYNSYSYPSSRRSSSASNDSNNPWNYVSQHPYFYVLSQLIKSSAEEQMIVMLTHPQLFIELKALVHYMLSVGVKPKDLESAGLSTELLIACIKEYSGFVAGMAVQETSIHDPLAYREGDTKPHSVPKPALKTNASPQRITRKMKRMMNKMRQEEAAAAAATFNQLNVKDVPVESEVPFSPPVQLSSRSFHQDPVSGYQIQNNIPPSRPQEATFNAYAYRAASASNKYTRQKFMEHRNHSYVMDISDSSDSDGDVTSKLTRNNSDTALKSKLLEKEEEIKRIAAMIEKKKKEKALKSSSSQLDLASVEQVEKAVDKGVDSVESLNASDQTIHSNHPSIDSVQEPATRTEQPVKSSESFTSLVSSLIAPNESPKRAISVFSHQHKLLMDKKILEAEISQHDIKVQALQQHVKNTEEEVEMVGQKLAQSSTRVTDLEAKSSEYSEKIQVLEKELASIQELFDTTRDELKKAQQLQDMSKTLKSQLKKQLLMRSNQVAEEQRMANVKRTKLVEVVKHLKVVAESTQSTSPNLKRKAVTSVPKTTVNGGIFEGNGSTKKFKLNLDEAGPEDFIGFSMEEEEKEAPPKPVPTSQPSEQAADHTRFLDTFSWENPKEKTIQFLYCLNDDLINDNDCIGIKDVYDHIKEGVQWDHVKMTLNGRWSRAGSLVHSHIESDENVTMQFKSYSSVLSHFRASHVLKGQRTLKLNPNVRLCIFETSGGTCNDKNCTSQHFKDIQKKVESLDHIVDLAEKSVKNPLLVREKVDIMKKLNLSQDEMAAKLVQHLEKNESGLSGLLGVAEIAAVPTMTRVADTIDSDEEDAGEGDVAIHHMLTLPVLVNGLQKVLDHEQVSHGRYFTASYSDEEYEVALKKNPEDVLLWINYAAYALPSSTGSTASTLTVSSLEKRSTNLNKALNILARALQINRQSPLLWNFYFEIYCRRGSDSDIRALFQQALGLTDEEGNEKGFVGDCVLIWWRFIMWEKQEEQKWRALRHFIVRLVSGDMNLDAKETSQALLEGCVAASQLLLHVHGANMALDFLFYFLSLEPRDLASFCDKLKKTALHQAIWLTENVRDASLPSLSGTVGFQVFSKSDYIKIWLLYIHLLYYKFFPQDIFYEYPYQHMIKPEYFEIVWRPHSVSTEILDKIDTLFKHIGASCVKLAASKQVSLLCFLKNCQGFSVLKDQVETVFTPLVSRVLEMNPGWTALKELVLSTCFQTHEMDLTEQEFTLCPGAFHTWNRYIKNALHYKDYTRFLLGLMNAVRCCFVNLDLYLLWDEDEMETRLKETGYLYERLLGLDESLDTNSDLVLAVDRRDVQSNVYTWIHYFIFKSLCVTQGDHMVGLCDKTELEGIFTSAFKYVTQQHGRVMLWREKLDYLTALSEQHEPCNKKWVFMALGKALEDAAITTTSPLFKMAKSDIDFTQPVPIKSLTLERMLLERLLDTLSRVDQNEIISIMAHKEAGVLSGWRSIQALYQSSIKHTKANHVLFAILRQAPHIDYLWSCAIAIQSFGMPLGRKSTAKLLLHQAKSYLFPSQLAAIKVNEGTI